MPLYTNASILHIPSFFLQNVQTCGVNVLVRLYDQELTPSLLQQELIQSENPTPNIPKERRCKAAVSSKKQDRFKRKELLKTPRIS